MCFKNQMKAWIPGRDIELAEDSVIRKFRITAAEVMRIARNDEESGNEEGGAE